MIGIKRRLVAAVFPAIFLFFPAAQASVLCARAVAFLAPEVSQPADAFSRLIETAKRDPVGASTRLESIRPSDGSTQAWAKIEAYGAYNIRRLYQKHFGGIRYERTPLKVKKMETRVKEELLPFLGKIQASRKTVVISFDGLDSAGKGVNIKLFRSLLKELIRENALDVQLKTVKLGKPEMRDMNFEEFTARWTSKLPEGPAIVFMDRSYYNRSYVEATLGFTDPKLIQIFRERVGAFEKSLADRGVELHKLFFSISLEHMLYNLLSRAMTEQRQHLVSPVDLLGPLNWNRYADNIRETIGVMGSDRAPGYFVDSSYFFRQGFDSTGSRKMAGLAALLEILNQTELNGGPKPRIREFERLVQVLREGYKPELVNERPYDRNTLEEIDLALWTLRNIVQRLRDAGLLSIDPAFAIQDKIDLGVPVQ